jgi:hypothetical protein
MICGSEVIQAYMLLNLDVSVTIIICEVSSYVCLNCYDLVLQATAIMYFKRFYQQWSVMEHDPKNIM